MASDRTPHEPRPRRHRRQPARPAPPTTAQRDEGAHASRGAARDAVAVQRARFGGIKWGAAFFGWLSANGLAVLLVALLSAAGVALGLANGVDTADEAAQRRPRRSASAAASPSSSCCSSPTSPAGTSRAAWRASTVPGRGWRPG